MMNVGGLVSGVVISLLLSAPMAMAAEGTANTFKPLPASNLLPGQIVSLDDQDLRIREALPPPCTGRSSKGVKAGTWIGAAAGIIAGAAVSDKNDSSVTTAAKALAGAGVGSTLGYLAGRAYDGPRDCPDVQSELPRSPIMPYADEVAWEERRRALAGGP